MKFSDGSRVEGLQKGELLSIDSGSNLTFQN